MKLIPMDSHTNHRMKYSMWAKIEEAFYKQENTLNLVGEIMNLNMIDKIGTELFVTLKDLLTRSSEEL